MYYENTAAQVGNYNYEDAQGNVVDSSTVAESTHYPRWMRIVSANIRRGGLAKSGYADFALVSSPDLKVAKQLAFCECKNSWNYPTEDILEIFAGDGSVLTSKNEFQRGKTGSVAHAVLRQVRLYY